VYQVGINKGIIHTKFRGNPKAFPKLGRDTQTQKALLSHRRTVSLKAK